jgi:YD repeat-containing protein
MKRYLRILCLLLCAVLLAGCVPSQSGNRSFSAVSEVQVTRNDNGKTTVSSLHYDTEKNTLTVVDGKRSFVFAFDGNGNLLSRREYLGEKEQGYTENTYDEKGRLVSSRSYSAGSDIMCVASSSGKREFTYDENGNLTKESSYRDDRLTGELFYRPDGTLSKQIQYPYGFGEGDTDTSVYDEEGKILTLRRIRYGKDDSGVDYIYDDQGRLIKEENYDGSQKASTMYLYDGQGNLVEKRHIDYSGNQASHLYTYDERGNLLSSRYSPDGEDSGYKWSYDEENRVVTMQTSYSDGWGRKDWTYDKNGLVATRTVGDTVYTYTYKYTDVKVPGSVQAYWEQMLHALMDPPVDPMLYGTEA